MATYEHATSIGVWFFKALVESSKLRQMTFNEEAAHHNKPNTRVQAETRDFVNYATFDQSHVLILQGVHTVVDEAAAPVGIINAYIPYPIGVGLGPYLRRPVPVVHGFRGIISPFPGTPTLANISYHNIDFANEMIDFHAANDTKSLPETNVGVTGIDAVTDYRTSLVIAHRWSNNDSGAGVGSVRQGGYLFWRTIGHVAVY